MPYQRPTLTELQQQVASDIASNVPGSDPLLRFANLKITGRVQAGLAHLHYGYIDYIAKQAVPWTSTGEYLAGWGALRNTFQKSPTAASGVVPFSGVPGTVIPAGSSGARGDGVTYTSQADAAVQANGVATVSFVADQLGAAGNCDAGTVVTLGVAIPGVQSSGAAAAAFTGGADAEEEDDFSERVMSAYQATPQGGAAGDYSTWALDVPGVTRAWVVRNGFGAGTVVVYVMLDDAQAAHGGFPQGADGVATGEQSRGVVAMGDQLTVANAIFPLQPVTALVYVCSPIANAINFTITGLSGASDAIKSAISAAIAGVFRANGAPGGTIDMSDINSAIGSIPGTSGFVITSPVGNITNTTGQLPTLGTITYP
ncbi:baseplate J/gp47 family protein [Pandoraea apista]|uniref:Phage baseplate protein n=1 Tax=Pandoraea apista TaxID=93218 RepID=A0A5E5PBN7_9BURK|nr:baseplate J/gp47 family protein [Pandoraea apista]OXS92619.1 phage baseplate protein [Pandoraea apista]VVG74108.1 phage baseplate protein [Pandoraea apista]